MVETIREPAHNVVVVGGGIAGLSAGFRLNQQGFSVLVLEAGAYLGGKMSSVRRDGWTFNRASTLLPAPYAALRRIVTDAGGPVLKSIDSSVGIPRNGVVHALRASAMGGLVDGLRTDLLPLKSKLKLRHLAIDAVKMRKALTWETVDGAVEFDVESVGEYVARRLDPEIGRWVIDPLMRGIFLVEADPMSVVDLMITVGKLLGGGLVGYPDGIDFAGRQLSRNLDVRLEARVDAVEKVNDGIEVTWHQDGQEHAAHAEGCVIAVSGPEVAPIYPQLDAQQREILEGLPYTAITKGVFALKKPIAAPNVVAVPRSESEGLGVICYDSKSMPGSVPAGKASLSSHWMTEWTHRHLDVSDDDLVPTLISDTERILPGISNLVEFVHIERWPRAALEPVKGLYKAISDLRSRIDPQDRVQLAGDYFGQSGINLSVTAGEQAAARLARALKHPSAADQVSQELL